VFWISDHDDTLIALALSVPIFRDLVLVPDHNACYPGIAWHPQAEPVFLPHSSMIPFAARASFPPSVSSYLDRVSLPILEDDCQSALSFWKPGSVLADARDDHSSGTFVTERLVRPTRTAAGNCHCRPYLVLLPVGLAMPPSLPKVRCALTAPFQPCPDRNPTAVCFLLRFPWSRLRRTLSGTVFPWSPDFPLHFARGLAERLLPCIARPASTIERLS